MIRTQYRKPGTAKARYVRKAIGQDFYKWCEQSADDPRYDIAQGTCEAEDLPTDIRQKCDEYNGAFYACEWPLHCYVKASNLTHCPHYDAGFLLSILNVKRK